MLCAGPDGPALQPVAWEVVFGPGADPALITDAKRGLDAILFDATEARLSFNIAGESALAARFESTSAAEAALNRYGSFFRFSEASGSDARGWTARRYQGQGEWNHVVTAGAEQLPRAYVEQLAPGGRIVIPLGSEPRCQTMYRFTLVDGSLRSEDLGGFAFVPLVGEAGWPARETE